ncbi:hypothetical protein Ahy_B10g101578 [Arachis hypogaea]|uniref:Aminotransferase-like plant mobile domain-containing protein n=1 Tax=Arachis hypogaea TaxID=3818 RepID=A0A444WZY1_ARAHY|nr:hypothetical protein Ahy_B10g101578 [Arachis hypogaea]
MLTCNHPLPPDRYNDRVEEHLRITGFYHVSQIGIVQCQKALVNALIERWHPDTHTFHLPIGECSVTLEDVALILGLPTDGLPVTGMTMSSFEAMEAECLLQFGIAPRREDCRSSCIKLTWLRNLKENLELNDEISIQRYVRCHIMLLIGTILFGDKSGAGVHWKFLPLLRDFVNIGQYSWGSACLAHLYRALCRASRYNFELIDNISLGGVTGSFVWVAYAVDRVDPNIIPAEIYMQSVVWSATVPLVSFECIEWHATDRFRRQFGFVQGVPSQEQKLDKAHGETLTGPKNLNWATTPTHSNWVMHWTNRYHYVLSEPPMPSQPSLDTYLNWYRSTYGNRLALSNLAGEENDEGNQDLDVGNEDMDEGNEDTDEGSQDMDEDNEEQEQHISPPVPPPQEQPQASTQYLPQPQFTPSFPVQQQYWGMSQFEIGDGTSFSQLLGFMSAEGAHSQHGDLPDFMPGRYSLDARYPGHTSSVASGGFVSVDSSRSDGGRGVLNSQNPNRCNMARVEEDTNALEQETDAYLVDDPDEEGDDDEDEIEEFDEDEESRNDGQARSPDDNVKGYNLRIDPPRRSANRFTPSVFKKAAKKCKNFVKDVKWKMRK